MVTLRKAVAEGSAPPSVLVWRTQFSSDKRAFSSGKPGSGLANGFVGGVNFPFRRPTRFRRSVPTVPDPTREPDSSAAPLPPGDSLPPADSLPPGDLPPGDLAPGDLAPELPSRGPDYHRALGYLYGQIDYERLAGVSSGYRFRLRRMRRLLHRLGLQHFLHRSGFPTGDPVETDGFASTGRPDRTDAPQSNRTGTDREPPKTSPARDPSLPPVPLVHIAGTKGKGSTAAMVAAMLTAAGSRTGLYTSPHLQYLEERFRVDGRLADENEFVTLVEEVRAAADRLAADGEGEASFFELTTAMALLHFHRRGCDAVVMEVGLGGRLDSTNVCGPSVSVITSIGLDHQHVLGDTVDEIAAEKAGIVKPNVPLVCGVRRHDDPHPRPPVDGRPAEVIAEIASRHGAPLFQIGVDFDLLATPNADWGSRLDFQSHSPSLKSIAGVELGTDGDHQAHNAAVAIAAVQLLWARHAAEPPARFADVLATLTCEARIERFPLPGNVVGIIDAAHNPDSIAALCETIRRRFADRPATIVFGTSRDKPAATMLRQLAPLADRMVLTRFHGNPRFVDPADLRDLAPDSLAGKIDLHDDPLAACQAALDSRSAGGLLLVCGSFFLAAETRPWMRGLRVTTDGTRPTGDDVPADNPVAADDATPPRSGESA